MTSQGQGRGNRYYHTWFTEERNGEKTFLTKKDSLLLLDIYKSGRDGMVAGQGNGRFKCFDNIFSSKTRDPRIDSLLKRAIHGQTSQPFMYEIDRRHPESLGLNDSFNINAAIENKVRDPILLEGGHSLSKLVVTAEPRGVLSKGTILLTVVGSSTTTHGREIRDLQSIGAKKVDLIPIASRNRDVKERDRRKGVRRTEKKSHEGKKTPTPAPSTKANDEDNTMEKKFSPLTPSQDIGRRNYPWEREERAGASSSQGPVVQSPGSKKSDYHIYSTHPLNETLNYSRGKSFTEDNFEEHLVHLSVNTAKMRHTCIICLMETGGDLYDDDSSDEEGSDLVKLDNCGHIFHRDCILQGFEHNPTCPICKAEYGTRRGSQPDGTMSVETLVGSRDR